MEDSKEVRQIPIEDIIPNRFQPRINFDEKALNELADSIKQHGIIQPLVLRPLGDKFEIIAGERRYKAATLAGLSTIPGIVTEMDDNTSAEVALIENVQRKDLSSIEEAKSYKSMLERSNMTQEELAKKMGLSQSTIANKLRLLNLADEVQAALSQEKISERHARALLSISDKAEQVKWLNRIINERLTVRQLDLAIKDELNSDNNEEDVPKVNINPDIESIINNAVDINPSPVENIEATGNSEVGSVQPSDNEAPKGPNKFFNYLEDQEVNMSTTEEPKTAEVNNTPPTEEFSFTPEFANAPENSFNPQPDEEVETLDVPDVTAENTVEETKKVDEPIFNEELVMDNKQETSEPVVETTVEEVPIADDLGNINTTPESASTDETTVLEAIENIEPVQENEEIEEFVFDDEESNEENDVTTDVAMPETVETPESPATEANEEEQVNVEPIPIIREAGVIDPVSYYDSLDPDFIDKVKEFIGLDLKNAINSYRELTDLLNKKGFNISIDETDLDGKYKIEIDINKE